MFIWSSQFYTNKPLINLPRLTVICSEEQFDTSYHWEGRLRPDTDACLFKYTLEGEGVFRYGDVEHRVGAGSGFLCRIKDPATAYYYPADAQGPWRFVWVQFEGGGVENIVAEMVERFGSVFQIPLSRGIMEKVMSFRSMESQHHDISASQGADIVYQLLMGLAGTRNIRQQETPASMIVRRARQLVQDNPQRNYNVSLLADELKVSREHLTRVFSKEVGTTPYNYIVRQKILLACKMLKETSLSSKEISARLGYNEPGHFTRMFRKSLQMPPIEFRSHGVMPSV